jgi:hypothetical protein
MKGTIATTAVWRHVWLLQLTQHQQIRACAALSRSGGRRRQLRTVMMGSLA